MAKATRNIQSRGQSFRISVAVAVGLAVVLGLVYAHALRREWPMYTFETKVKLPLGNSSGGIGKLSYPPFILSGTDCGLAAVDVSPEGAIYIADSSGKLFVKRASGHGQWFPNSAIKGCEFMRWNGPNEIIAIPFADQGLLLRFDADRPSMPPISTRLSGGELCSIGPGNARGKLTHRTGEVHALRAGPKGDAWITTSCGWPPDRSPNQGADVALRIPLPTGCILPYNVFNVPRKGKAFTKDTSELSMVVSEYGTPVSSQWAYLDSDGWEAALQVDEWRSPTGQTFSRIIDLRSLGAISSVTLMACDNTGNLYLQYDYRTPTGAKKFEDNDSTGATYCGTFMAIALVRNGSNKAEPLFDIYSHYRSEIRQNWHRYRTPPNPTGIYPFPGNALIGVDAAHNVYLEFCDGVNYRVDKISFPPQPPKPWWRVW